MPQMGAHSSPTPPPYVPVCASVTGSSLACCPRPHLVVVDVLLQRVHGPECRHGQLLAAPEPRQFVAPLLLLRWALLHAA